MKLRMWVVCAVLASLVGLSGSGSAQVDNSPDLKGVIDLHAHVAPETKLLNFSGRSTPSKPPRSHAFTA